MQSKANNSRRYSEWAFLKLFSWDVFSFSFNNLDFIEIWTKILNILGKIESTKKADHILEMLELEECCGYGFKNHPF